MQTIDYNDFLTLHMLFFYSGTFDLGKQFYGQACATGQSRREKIVAAWLYW